MAKTIYYLPKYGQLGNQLAVLAHLLAFAIDYNYTIVHFKSDVLLQNLKKEEIDKIPVFFSSRLANPKISFCLNKALKIGFLNRNFRLLKYLILNKEYNVDKEFNPVNMPRTILVTHWLFRYYSGVFKHQNSLRKILSFDEVSFTYAREVLLSVKNKFPLHSLVGVHVRRGDYANFLNGKFFFGDAVYYSNLVHIAAQLKECVFIICSNEDLNFPNEASLNIIYAKGSPAEDIFILSKCSYIIGPPSTFSSWAAFLGDQNLLFLKDKNEDVSLDKFGKYYL